MKLTKYEHACIVLEEQGKKLVIDPGDFTPEFGGTDNIVAVVVTHEHTDHFGEKHLNTIIQANPGVKIFTTIEVKKQFDKPNVTAVKAGQQETVEPFTLVFSGDMHAASHPSLPVPHNTAILVNDVFFCPGDSFTKPDKPIDVLALPSNAPWTDISGSMDYLAEVMPKRCVPTHDGLLSDNGRMVYNGILGVAAKAANTELLALKSGESIEI